MVYKQSFNHSIFYITHSKQNDQYLSHLKGKNWLLSQEIGKLLNQILNPQINTCIQTTMQLDDLITCIQAV